MPAWLDSSEGSLPGLQTAAFSLYTHSGDGDGEISLFLLLIRLQSL